MALYCEHCKVHIGGTSSACPLCQNPLPPGESIPSVFPELSSDKSKWGLLIRTLLFISFAAVVICIATDALLPNSSMWPWYVAAGIGCMWLCLINVLIRRHNIPKNILWMVFWLSMLCLAWDYFTGWHRWSLDYVIPSLCVSAMFSVSIISRILGRELGEYMIYLIIDALFGIIPLLFLTMDWVTIRYPSIVCIAVSVLFLGALCTFKSRGLSEEIKKRLHL